MLLSGSGEENTYDASALAEEGDNVVVTVSYRLGVLGYAYDETLPCQDMGLKDQMAALNWVHQYIHLFGGDTSRITVAGQSAGGYSVAAMFQTVKEPLFRRAIMLFTLISSLPDANTKRLMFSEDGCMLSGITIIGTYKGIYPLRF